MNRKYLVKEIFGPTIQGEGRFTGTPVVFVRFSKCNRWNGREESKKNSICNYCDTDFVGGDFMDFKEILIKIKSISSIKNVVITGGEPMLQLRDTEFFKQLTYCGYSVQLETNGSIPVPMVDGLSVTVSPKQTAKETMVRSSADYKFLYPWIGKDISPFDFDLTYIDRIYVQPIDRDGENNIQGAFQQVLKLNEIGIPAKLSLQTHKYGNFE